MTPPQKERIIDQAMQMFATQGIKSVRMDDIAQHLGVSKRTLYELFGDKEGLLYLAMERYFQRDRQRWTELTANARNVLEAMFMVLAQVMDKAEVSSRMMDNLKKFYPAVHDKLTREGMEKNRRSLRGMLDQGIVDGLFVDNINIDLAISVLYYTASALVARKEPDAARRNDRARSLRADNQQFLPRHFNGQGAADDRRQPEKIRTDQVRQIKIEFGIFYEKTDFNHVPYGGGRFRRCGTNASHAR